MAGRKLTIEEKVERMRQQWKENEIRHQQLLDRAEEIKREVENEKNAFNALILENIKQESGYDLSNQDHLSKVILILKDNPQLEEEQEDDEKALKEAIL